MANTLAYYDTATITEIKSFIVYAPKIFSSFISYQLHRLVQACPKLAPFKEFFFCFLAILYKKLDQEVLVVRGAKIK
jgi:hypothetical protein